MRQHVIVCGYGTKGRSAIRSLQALGTPLDKIVVVDPEPRAIDEANSLGLTGIVGDAGRTEVLRRASVERARAVIVAANRDDAAVLITLTVRQLNPTVPITTSVREEENANLLRQSGADTVITTSATSGRLLGLSTDAPRVVAVVEDLVTGGQGLDLHQRTVDLQRGGPGPAVAARHRPVGHPRRPHAALRRPADRHPAARATSSSSSASTTDTFGPPKRPPRRCFRYRSGPSARDGPTRHDPLRRLSARNAAAQVRSPRGSRGRRRCRCRAAPAAARGKCRSSTVRMSLSRIQFSPVGE